MPVVLAIKHFVSRTHRIFASGGNAQFAVVMALALSGMIGSMVVLDMF
jgi:hypothetical protein